MSAIGGGPLAELFRRHPPRRCAQCGCTDTSPCLVRHPDGRWQPCGWVHYDDGDLCSACLPEANPSLTAPEINAAMHQALDAKLAERERRRAARATALGRPNP